MTAHTTDDVLTATLPTGEFAELSRITPACDHWQVVVWGSEADYKADREGDDPWADRATYSVATDGRDAALAELAEMQKA